MLRIHRPHPHSSSSLRQLWMVMTLVALGLLAAKPAAAQNGFTDIRMANGNIDVLENMVSMAEAAQRSNPNQNVWSSATMEKLGGYSGPSTNQMLSNWLIEGGEAVSRSERTRNPTYAQAWVRRNSSLLPYLQADIARMNVSQSIYRSNLLVAYRNQASNARNIANYYERQAVYAGRTGNWAAARWYSGYANNARQWASNYEASAAALDE